MTTPTPEQVAEEAAAKAPDRTVKQKALTVTEKKQIEKLINADFDLLIQDLAQYKREIIRAKTLEVNAKYADREEGINVLTEEWRLLRERMNAMVHDFRESIRERGYTISTRGFGRDMYSANPVTFDINGKDQELRQIEEEAGHIIARAKHALERKRSDAIRNLLMSGGVPEEARQIMGNMPTAQDTILEALNQNPGQSLRLLGAAVQQQQAQVRVQQDGDTIEGLVVHDETDYRQGVPQ